jgi:hypothetical protein
MHKIIKKYKMYLHNTTLQDEFNNRWTTRLYTWPTTNFFLNHCRFLNTNTDSRKNYLYKFYTLEFMFIITTWGIRYAALRYVNHKHGFNR